MTLIACEGSSYAGKTTLATSLGAEFDACVIKEYIEYAPGEFPDFPKTEEELDRQLDFYIGLESERARDVEACHNNLAVVDRTAASLIAFQGSMQELDLRDGVVWNPIEAKERVLVARSAGHIIVPDLVLLLTAGSEDRHNQRVQERGGMATSGYQPLNSWEFSELVRENTKKALSEIFPAIEVIDCVTEDESRGVINLVREKI